MVTSSVQKCIHLGECSAGFSGCSRHKNSKSCTTLGLRVTAFHLQMLYTRKLNLYGSGISTLSYSHPNGARGLRTEWNDIYTIVSRLMVVCALDHGQAARAYSCGVTLKPITSPTHSTVAPGPSVAGNKLLDKLCGLIAAVVPWTLHPSPTHSPAAPGRSVAGNELLDELRGLGAAVVLLLAAAHRHEGDHQRRAQGLHHHRVQACAAPI